MDSFGHCGCNTRRNLLFRHPEIAQVKLSLLVCIRFRFVPAPEHLCQVDLPLSKIAIVPLYPLSSFGVMMETSIH